MFSRVFSTGAGPRYSLAPDSSDGTSISRPSVFSVHTIRANPIRSFLVAFGALVLVGTLSYSGHAGTSDIGKLSSQGKEASTFDVIGREGGFRMLHLIDKPTTEALMDRWFIRSHMAFEEAPSSQVEKAIMFGPGFPGYDPQLSIVQNIEKQFGRKDAFDACLAYFNNDQYYHLQVDPAPFFGELKELSQHMVVIDRPHEMRDGRRAPFYEMTGATLSMAPYPNDVFAYRRFMHDILFVHQPHFIDADLFDHPVQQPRPVQVTLPGSLEEQYYPLRKRLAGMIENGLLPGQVRAHPGYFDILNDTRKEELGVSATKLENQLADYSNSLGNAKICLITSSRWKYSLQKYTEAAAAGCLLIGSIPFDRTSDFKKFVIEIHNGMKDDEIVKIVEYWLDPARDDERMKVAKIGQDWAVGRDGKSGFTLEPYVADVIEWVRLAKNGRKGVIFPYEWEFLPDPPPMDG